MVQKNDVFVGFGMNDLIPLDFQIPEVEEVPQIQPQGDVTKIICLQGAVNLHLNDHVFGEFLEDLIV
jgi:hypothetical protein